MRSSTRLTGGVGALLKKAKVRTLLGTATIVDGKTVTVSADTGETRIAAEHLVLATGSEPVELPALPFGGDILSSTDALALTEVPRSLAVVGAGYIGMELGMAFAKLGARVTIVEALPKILPLYDAELTQPVVRRLADLGVETLLGARALGFANGALKVMGADGKERSVPADKALVAVGRRAAHERLRARDARPDDERPVRPHRRDLRDVDAQRLGDWRRNRRADARPSRHGAGRDGRRDHRRAEARLRPCRDSARSVSPIRRSSPSAFRQKPPGPRMEKFASAIFRSAPMAGR